jgi:diguanylate cyclase (GGDEF)-like protein
LQCAGIAGAPGARAVASGRRPALGEVKIVSTRDGAGKSVEKGTIKFFPVGGGAAAHDSAAVLVDAVDMRIVDASPRAAVLLGHSVANLAGRILPDLIEPSRTDDGAAADDRPAPVCYRLTGASDESAFYGMSSASFTHEGRKLDLYLFHDVTLWVDLKTDLTNRNLELSHLARHDHLTNLFNRMMFRDTLELANARLGRLDGCLGVLYIDLDGFKKVNDRLGHDAGDDVLVEVARRLRDGVRTSDVAARLGGDEFGVILENLRAPEDALKVARHIIGLVAKPISVVGETVAISASVGAAVTDRPVVDAASLVTTADRMMFEARSRGHGYAALASDAGPT